MKILLQSEAKTISDRELADNQQYLIDIFARINHSIFGLPKKTSKIN